MIDDFNFENQPLDILEFELENAKANRKIAKQSLNLVKEQIPYLVPMKRAFMESHGGEDFDTTNLSYDGSLRLIRISDTADCLLADKLRLEDEIKHCTKAIIRYSNTLKKAGAQA